MNNLQNTIFNIVKKKLTESSGDLVTVNVFWDGDVSKMDFDESFESLYSTNRGNSLILAYGVKMDSSELIKKEIDVKKLPYKEESDLYYALESKYGDDFESEKNLIDVEDLVNLIFDNLNQREVIDTLRDCLREMKLNLVRSVGYSQGDVAYVITDGEPDKIKKYIDNLIWDSPLYMRVDVNGEEYDYNDFGGWDDEYKYDYSDALKFWNKVFVDLSKTDDFIKENIEQILQELEDKLPKDPSYN